MKTKFLLLTLSAVLCLLISPVQASIYMGTSVQPEQAAPAPETAYPTGLVPQNGYQQGMVNCNPTPVANPNINCNSYAAMGDAPMGRIALSSYPVKTGSLKENVERIVNQSKWGKVVWTLPFDYNWIGNMNIQAATVQQALYQLLKPYPVQAVFYNKNHVVAIVPRRSI